VHVEQCDREERRASVLEVSSPVTELNSPEPEQKKLESEESKHNLINIKIASSPVKKDNSVKK
jgi:hypothetical protein